MNDRIGHMRIHSNSTHTHTLRTPRNSISQSSLAYVDAATNSFWCPDKSRFVFHRDVSRTLQILWNSSETHRDHRQRKYPNPSPEDDPQDSTTRSFPQNQMHLLSNHMHIAIEIDIECSQTLRPRRKVRTVQSIFLWVHLDRFDLLWTYRSREDVPVFERWCSSIS